MELKNYESKKVIIEATDGKIYRGLISDYVFPEDNENDKESIIMEAIGYRYAIEFYEEHIKSIEIMI